MVATAPMPNLIPLLNRRAVLAGLGATALVPWPGVAAPVPVLLKAQAATLALRPGAPATPIWQLSAANGSGPLRLATGERAELNLANELPAAILLSWHGLDGAAAAEPLIAVAPTAPGATENIAISTFHAGTLMMDFRLLQDGTGVPARPLAVIVPESEPIAADRDEVMLIEDWRLAADGAGLLPGGPATAVPIYTVNGQITPELTVRPNERLRLRFINGCQRAVIAIKVEGHEVQVMALDSQPAEPFTARNGALVLPPGGRCDTLIDATAPPGTVSAILLHDGAEARAVARLATATEPVRPARLPAAAPLPANGLPDRLDLKGAVRADLSLGTPGDWIRPQRFSASAPPAFRARQGRTVVLALNNPADSARVFHLHGHHFRLLDRLDDGWKPFWLDTLAIEPGQTQRIAFAASHAGRWLVESVGTDWSAPRLVRWYAVE